MSTVSPQKSVIGFIGTGVMGRSMAGHILDAGYTVHVHNRTKEKARELVERGALWQDTAGAVAEESDLVITIVGFPTDVEATYFADDGILAHVKPASYVIDMTTSKPSLAKRIYDEARARDVRALDAPVSGGDTGARNAALSIMVGGDRQAFEEVLPVLKLMGGNIVLQGPAGSGQYTKMANQIAIAAGMVAVCEALAYAKRAGLDQETVLKSIGSGAAGSWSLNNLGPRMIAGNFGPGFYVKHFIKDMTIALESAKEMGLETPGLELAKSMYERLARDGGEDLGTQALYTLFNR